MRKITLFALSAFTISSLAVAKPLPGDLIRKEVLGPKNAETLVMTHGAMGTLDTYRLVVNELSKSYRVVVYDLRGHGATADLGDDYSMPVLAGDLASLLDSLEIPSAHILGSSHGARVAIQFASMFPERTKSLIIEDMDGLPRIPKQDALVREKVASLREKNLPRATQAELLTKIAKDFGKATLSPSTVERIVQLPSERFTFSFYPHVALAFGYEANSVDLTPEIATLRMPVLVLSADRSQSALSKEGLESFRALLPQMKFHVVVGAPHCIHGYAPSRFAFAVLNFLDHLKD